VTEQESSDSGIRDRRVIPHREDHGSESPDFNQMTPAPNPGLTWILS